MESLVFFAVILVAFYLLVIRPQRARLKAAQALQAQLAPGVEVMTTSGLYGTVTEVEDDVVHLLVSPGSTVRVAKPAVGRIIDPTLQDDATPVEKDEADQSADHPTHD